MKNPIIVIPARKASTRLPNKPLRHINGIPMIIHVLKKAQEADVADVLVAVDSKDIYECIKDYKGNAILTDRNLPSGTDRIKQALDIYDKCNNYDLVINVQGDLPTITKSSIVAVLSLLTNAEYKFDITTLVNEISLTDECVNINNVKAVISWHTKDIGKALYFSRYPIPYGSSIKYHHIGIYGYHRNILNKFVNLPVSALENHEKLEQLRALENDIKIGVTLVNEDHVGVDTEEDLIKVSKFLL